MNATLVTVAGTVLADPHSRQTPSGIPVTSFRLASTERRRDATGTWVDVHTNYVQVTCWRQMGDRAAACLRRGDHVVVHGRAQVKDWEDKDGLRRTVVDIEAHAFGPDLARNAATVVRPGRVTVAEATPGAERTDEDRSAA
jgi:single-strand DNA-binding protein